MFPELVFANKEFPPDAAAAAAATIPDPIDVADGLNGEVLKPAVTLPNVSIPNRLRLVDEDKCEGPRRGIRPLSKRGLTGD